MILFSPAKINIGLQITEKRADGFHNLRSVMWPTGLCDILEIRPVDSVSLGMNLHTSGIPLDTGDDQNLCEKAYGLLARESPVPPVDMFLHKQIPAGAGLGGGSSNASITLKALNALSPEPVTGERLEALAAQLGSDCPFFLQDEPRMMEGRGELLRPVSLYLDTFWLVILFPGVHVSTADAYAGVTPDLPEEHLESLLRYPVERWKEVVVNDFERSVFVSFPALGSLKEALYKEGAVYASMSGSGSSLFGIFRESPLLSDELEKIKIWQGPALS